jgi:hypothetical protein
MAYRDSSSARRFDERARAVNDFPLTEGHDQIIGRRRITDTHVHDGNRQSAAERAAHGAVLQRVDSQDRRWL